MVDVRPLAFVAPIDEQVLDDILPAVSVKSMVDEGAYVTGRVAVYRTSLGTKLYESVLHPSTIAAGQTITMTAETVWSPGAVVDDDYFIMCYIDAVNTGSGHNSHNVLGPYTFDIKPGPMGAAPAAHHVTHENGGIDEISIAGLSGLTADEQNPRVHGSIKHDGTVEATANKSTPGGYAGLPNPLDSTRPLRGDGQAKQPEGLYLAMDYTHNNNQTMIGTWQGAAIASGTTAMIAGEVNHPGVLTLNSAAGANSGYFFRSSLFAFLIAGNERADFVFRPQTLAGLVSRRGFIDSFGTADEGDGCYLEIATVGPNPGVIVGKTATFAARSTTATSYQLITNTWYRGRIQVNANATRVDFYLFSEAGALLWTDNLTTNIPTTATHETGHGVVSHNTLAAANALTDEDFMDLEINRVFVR